MSLNKNILTFDEWAILGKDEGMEKGHHASVKHMLNNIFAYYEKKSQQYSVIDLGCGNGWVVRKFSNHKNCNIALGVDGAPAMIDKAKNLDDRGNYINTNIEDWEFNGRFDIIFSMETFYYFKDHYKVLNNVNKTLNKNGIFIMGIDHYLENIPSLSWDKEFNLSLNTLSIEHWINALKECGFKNIKHSIFGKKENWNGTLIIYAIKK